MVCNGHYSVPARPAIPGLEQFGGRVEHSHDYRGPEQYTGEAVVVLGAAASGTDISMELATTATTVYLSSYNPPLASVLPPNVQQVIYKGGQETGMFCLPRLPVWSAAWARAGCCSLTAGRWRPPLCCSPPATSTPFPSSTRSAEWQCGAGGSPRYTSTLLTSHTQPCAS